jgi:hypothetical protein
MVIADQGYDIFTFLRSQIAAARCRLAFDRGISLLTFSMMFAAVGRGCFRLGRGASGGCAHIAVGKERIIPTTRRPISYGERRARYLRSG